MKSFIDSAPQARKIRVYESMMNTDTEQNCPKNKKLPPNLLPN